MGKTVVAIHQPNFLPWLGYYYKISQSDIFVFLDDVEYTKNSFINRNRIKTPNGEAWITLPVSYSGKSTQKINECQIVGKDKAVKKILGQILHNYKQAEFFEKYYESLSDILNNSGNSLAELNINLTIWISKLFKFKVRFVRSSELGILAIDPTDRLIQICQYLHGEIYLSGSGGMKYQEEIRFTKTGIKLKISSFQHPTYCQIKEGFLPNLSVIDYLFNEGPVDIVFNK